MSVELDTLLTEMNQAKKSRLESDIPLNDPYWAKKQQYQNALHLANNVHIPVVKDLGVDEVSAVKAAVVQQANLQAKDLSESAVALGKAKADVIVAESEVKIAEKKLEDANKPAPDPKTALELEIEAAKAKLEVATKKLEVAEQAHVEVKNRPIDIKKLEDDLKVVDSKGTAPTTEIRNPNLNSMNPSETEAERVIREANESSR